MLVTAANKLDFRTSVFPVHVYHRASAVIIEVTLNLLFDTRRRFLWNIVFITIIRSIGYFTNTPSVEKYRSIPVVMPSAVRVTPIT